MRVTIKHREESAGIAGAGRDYFVDCRVDFSEEEKAIIRARDLSRRGFSVAAARPAPQISSIIGTGVIHLLGGVLVIAGFVLGGVATFSGWHDGGLTAAMFFGGIALVIYGWLRGRGEERRLDQPDQFITLRQLLSQPFFTVSVSDPADGKQIEEAIHSHLVGIKELIRGSAELNKPSTFEL